MHGKKHLAVLDTVIAVLLFLLCAYAGRQHLASLNHGRSPVTSIEMLYGPAVMMACGRGFYQPDLGFSPTLRQFLRNERESLSPADLPENLPEEANSVSSYHRYLLYTVAFFWKIYGISWSALEPLCAILLGICAIAIYGIMRLGMGRLLSAALTPFFILSPQMLTMLPMLRDFSKAPFILLLIFMLGALIKYHFRFNALATLSLLLGLINGIAMGFRQDALVFVVPALVIITIATFRTVSPAHFFRLAPPIFFLIAFTATAHPMLGRMEGGAQPYHPLVQGFSMKRAASLGLEPGAYEPLASGSDNYAFAMLQEYYRRTNNEPDANFGFNSPGAEKAGRQFLMDMALHFPGDLLARGYAALFRTLRYTDGMPVGGAPGSPWKDLFEKQHFALKSHLHRFGLFYAVLAILLISGHSLPLAFGLLVFILYVCGYVSLQCEFRHAFHLSFVPLWIIGFLLNCLAVTMFRLRKGFTPKTERWPKPLVRMAVFSLCASLLLFSPLYLLRFYQHFRVAPLVSDIVSSERIPVGVTEHAAIKWTRFLLNEPNAPPQTKHLGSTETDLKSLYTILAAIIRSAKMENGQASWQTRVRYFALELAPDIPLKWLTLFYESPVPWNNFSQVIRIHPPQTRCSSLYFFPVYELAMPEGNTIVRNRFTGFALPEEQASAFQGLYEIQDISRLHFLMHTFVPTDTELSNRLHYRIQCVPDPTDAFRVDDEGTAITGTAEAAARFGELDDAELLYTAALMINPDPELSPFIAQALSLLRKYDTASRILVAYLAATDEQTPYTENLLAEIIQHYARENDMNRVSQILQSMLEHLAQKNPDLLLRTIENIAPACPMEFLEKQCEQLLRIIPEYQPAADILDTWMHDRGKTSELAAFWRNICAEYPGSVQPFLRLGLAYEYDGADSEAETAYATARANDPSCAEAAIRHAVVLLKSRPAEDIWNEITRAVEKEPRLKALAAQLLEGAGDLLSSQDRKNEAEHAYGLAFAYDQNKALPGIKQALMLIETRRFEEALPLIKQLTASERREEALSLLDRLWKTQKTEDERKTAWQDMFENNPKDLTVRRLYAESLFDSGSYAETEELIRNGESAWRAEPEREVLYAIADFAAGAGTPNDIAAIPLWTQHTELKSKALSLLTQAAQHMESRSLFEDALRLTKAAALISPDSTSALLTLGQSHESNGRYEDALHLYWQLFSSTQLSEQNDIADRIDLLYERLHQQDTRLAQWKEIYQKNGNNPVAAFHFGLACEVKFLWQEASDAYSTIVSPESLKTMADLRHGVMLLHLEKVEEGAGLIRSSVSKNPKIRPIGATLSLQAGNDMLLTGHLDNAEIVSRLAVELAPEDAFILLLRGNVLKAKNRDKEAADAWRNALRSGLDTMAGAEAGRHLDLVLPVEERLRLWQEFVSAHPESSYPKARLALAFALAGKTETALTLCRSNAIAGAQDNEFCFSCALTECLAGDTKQGLSKIDAVLKQAPYLKNDALAALDDFGLQLYESGNYENSELLLKKVTELGPENLLYYVHLGRTLLARRNYEEAAAQFRKVLLEVPESPNTATLLDEALAGLNKPEERLREWRTIVEAHPSASIPRNHLEALQ